MSLRDALKNEDQPRRNEEREEEQEKTSCSSFLRG